MLALKPAQQEYGAETLVTHMLELIQKFVKAQLMRIAMAQWMKDANASQALQEAAVLTSENARLDCRLVQAECGELTVLAK
jgi:predicted metalloendopeptidase